MLRGAAIWAEVRDEYRLGFPFADVCEAVAPCLEVDVRRRRWRQREHVRREPQTRGVASPHETISVVEVADVVRRVTRCIARIEWSSTCRDVRVFAENVQVRLRHRNHLP